MDKFKSTNPYSNEVIEEFTPHTNDEVHGYIDAADNAYKEWRKTSFEHRSKLMHKAADVLKAGKEKYAKAMVQEMGKPITEAIAEIEKCAWVCEFYADNAEEFLKEEVIETDADKSLVRYAPIGTVLAVMPWNYPYWQVFRFAAPALMAGNVCLLKHARNVLRCSLFIEEIFADAGFPEGTFKSLILSPEQIEPIVENPKVKAVTLTGSEGAGKSVAAIAGKNIKKTVLELGGSNAFVVLDDADIEAAAKEGCNARMMNTGQSCIAAKRFIVMKEVADKFTELLKQNVEKLKLDDPMKEDTKLGPLARVDLAEDIEEQVERSIEAGATLLMGHKREGAIYHPTILTNVQPGMPAFDEEIFGPVAAIIVAESEEEALELANKSNYGLGMSVCTSNMGKAEMFIKGAEDGAVFINSLVKSDPRLPFGGTKNSGYGRELSAHGIREFVNAKTIYIKGIS